MMRELGLLVMIKLNSVQDVKDFVANAAKLQGDITVSTGRFTVDGKSIMGLFSLDISKPLMAELSNPDDYGLLDTRFLAEQVK